jgi:hypothetical protein
MKKLKLWQIVLIVAIITLVSGLVKSPFQMLDLMYRYGLPWGWAVMSMPIEPGIPSPWFDLVSIDIGMLITDFVVWFALIYTLNKLVLKKR